ncbi:MAG: hypothetical protein IT266_07485 [Saprospiraceae bacterium]|nr:hypothetical protein [Saprospiraceae bacterium]
MEANTRWAAKDTQEISKTGLAKLDQRVARRNYCNVQGMYGFSLIHSCFKPRNPIFTAIAEYGQRIEAVPACAQGCMGICFDVSLPHIQHHAPIE